MQWWRSTGRLGVMAKLLDLFCGAGGAGMGYARAGFDVYGVDIEAQPNYPFKFCQHDAITFPLDGFDVIHASPPCRDYTSAAAHLKDAGTAHLLPDTIARLKGNGALWVVENIDSHAVDMGGWHFTLCGSSFGLRIRRHRRFGSNVLMLSPPCMHKEQGQSLGVYGRGGNPDKLRPGKGIRARLSSYAELMGMEWAAPSEIAQAIPPAYTEWIGTQLMRELGRA